MGNYTIDQITEAFRDDEKIEDLIADLDKEKFEQFLLCLHSSLIGISQEKDFIVKDGVVTCGENMLVSPSKDVEEKALAMIPQALKQIGDNKDRGVMLHYLINELHLFSDGNGRTGRAILEMFLNKEFDLNGEMFHHKTSGSQEKTARSYELNEKYNMKNPERALALTSCFLARVLHQNDLISQKIDISKFAQAKVFTDGYSDFADRVFIPEEFKGQLSEKQRLRINVAFGDNTGVICPSALAIMMMYKQLGREVEDSPSDEIYITSISTGKEEGGAETFEGWKEEDYIKAIQIYDKMHEMLLSIMVDAFEKPEAFMIDGTTMRETLENNMFYSRRMMIEVRNAAEKGTVNLEGTRTQKVLEELIELIQSREIKDDGRRVETTELGKQTLDVLKDTVLLDSVDSGMKRDEQNVHEQTEEEHDT